MNLDVTGASSECGGVTEPYTGAMVTTNPRDGRGSGGFQYTYGFLEARVNIPATPAVRRSPTGPPCGPTARSGPPTARTT